MLTPVIDDETGEVILYDVWRAGCWIGSARTIKLCIEKLGNERWPSSVLATNYRIEHGSPHKIIFENL